MSACLLLTGCEPAVLRDSDLESKLAIDQFNDDVTCRKTAQVNTPEYSQCMQTLKRQEIGE